MQNAHAGQIAQAAGLQGHGIRTGNRRLRSNHGCGCSEHHKRQQQIGRDQQKEGVVYRPCITQQQSALTKVVDDQRREHQPNPAQTHSPAAKVAHVGIQRLGTRHGQKHGREQEKGFVVVVDGKAQRMHGVDGLQHHGRLHHTDHTDPGQADEPDNGDGAEQAAHAARALHLDGEQPDQNAYGDGHDEMLKIGRGDAHAFYG